MARESEKANGFLVGILIGGIIGGALALFYTPLTGKKLRKKMLRKADDVKEKAGGLKDKANDLVKEGKKKAESLIEEAKKIAAN